MRYFALIISTVVVCLIHPSVYAGEPNAAYMLDMAEKLNGHRRTLVEMRKGVPSDDWFNVLELMSNALKSTDDAYALAILLYLRSNMVDKSDWAVVNVVLKHEKTSFEATCRTNIERINVQIGSARSPGVVSEGEHLRDDLVAVCDRVKSMK